MFDLSFEALDREIVVPNRALYCQQLSSLAIRELQAVLKSADYYTGQIDGIYGVKTLQALSGYKKDSYFARPTEIGPGTVAALKKLADKATINEQAPLKKPKLELMIGKHVGAAVMLPGNIKVHEHELILPDVPLTWGEMTKGLTRVPESEEIVRNIRYMAEKFGKIRGAIAQPLKVTSGYRPPDLKIGASKSQHKLALAFDLCPFNPGDLWQLWNVCTKSDAVGLGRGMKKGFVHADWRRTGERRVVFDY